MASRQPDPATELDEYLEIAAGRRAPFTQLGDWVALSGVSPQAQAIYWHLSMHLNQQRGDFEVWPTRATLARWCGYSREQSVDRYLDELVELNAIEVYQRRYGTGMRRRNVYVVHQQPPEGYTGPRSLQEWYARERARVAESSVASSASSAQSSAEFGSEFGSEFGKSAGHTVMRSSACREVRSSACREVRSSAWKPDEEKQDEEVTTSPQPPAPSPRASTPLAQQEEGEAAPAEDEVSGEVWAMLTSLPIPAGKRAPGRRSRKLGEVAARCQDILAHPTRYGLTLADLREHLAADLDTVRHSIVGCWLYRLADTELPEPRRRSSSSPRRLPACSHCGAREGEPISMRMVTNPDTGRASRCGCATPRPAVPPVDGQHATSSPTV